MDQRLATLHLNSNELKVLKTLKRKKCIDDAYAQKNFSKNKLRAFLLLSIEEDSKYSPRLIRKIGSQYSLTGHGEDLLRLHHDNFRMVTLIDIISVAFGLVGITLSIISLVLQR